MNDQSDDKHQIQGDLSKSMISGLRLNDDDTVLLNDSSHMLLPNILNDSTSVNETEAQYIQFFGKKPPSVRVSSDDAVEVQVSSQNLRDSSTTPQFDRYLNKDSFASMSGV